MLRAGAYIEVLVEPEAPLSPRERAMASELAAARQEAHRAKVKAAEAEQELETLNIALGASSIDVHSGGVSFAQDAVTGGRERGCVPKTGGLCASFGLGVCVAPRAGHWLKK